MLFDESVFEGFFKDDNITGKGNYVYKEGKLIKGEWMQNKLIKIL